MNRYDSRGELWVQQRVQQPLDVSASMHGAIHVYTYMYLRKHTYTLCTCVIMSRWPLITLILVLVLRTAHAQPYPVLSAMLAMAKLYCPLEDWRFLRIYTTIHLPLPPPVSVAPR